MEFEKIAGYKFNNPALLKTALTHTSYANEKKVESNQRLEFLGDSVIGLVIGEYIYKKYSTMPEGKLSKIKAGIVCEKGLSSVAKELGLNKMLVLGKGESMSGGADRSSNLEDAFEAVMGAIYLDSDFETVKKVILTVMKDIIDKTVENRGIEDNKTALQEYVQSKGILDIEYVITGEAGPDHAKVYNMAVYIGGEKAGEGTGKSKKDAEQSAAKAALEHIGKNETL